MSDEKQGLLNINDVRDHQRWLIDNGFMNDMHKDQIYLFGAILHKSIEAIELSIDVENKLIEYALYVPKELIKKISKFNKLSNSDSLWDLWRLKRMLKTEGNLNFTQVVSIFIKDYCGPKWTSKVKMIDIAEYKDGYERQEELSRRDNQLADKR